MFQFALRQATRRGRLFHPPTDGSRLSHMFSRVAFGLLVAALPGFCDWNPQLAANHLDGRQKEWFAWPRANTAVGVCVSCHTGLPYMLARPALRTVLKEAGPSSYETSLLNAVKKRIPTFGTTPAEPVLTALLLAEQDARNGRVSKETDQVFDSLWSLQIASGASTGAWNWNNTGRDPFSAPYGQFYGAALAALAIGVAPDAYQSRPQIQKNLDALKMYLEHQRNKQPLHNQLVLVWASTQLKGVLGDADRKTILTEAIGKQQPDGGWTLESLGPWSPHPDAPHSDGSNPYATGLATFVLETTGLSAANPNVERARAWLRSHQDPESGFWDAQSMNTRYQPGSMPSQFMRDVPTGFAVLALTEIP
jgi:squalene-hopene/tetraprenyl-beta-curcumene cyclase